MRYSLHMGRAVLGEYIFRGIKWLAEEAWEKINVFETWRELKALGRKHGPRFFVAAVLWELVEDVLFPYLAWRAGIPALIPVFLVLHFEPVVYPVFFFLFRTWDRMRGLEPWDPDRSASSAYWRSGMKVTLYRIVSLTLFYGILNSMGLSIWLLTAYTGLMMLFGFVHERLWHDSNFGINVETDEVSPLRNVAKATSYRAVSALIMSGVLFGVHGEVPLGALALYQGVMFAFHIALETLWSKTTIGLRPVQAE